LIKKLSELDKLERHFQPTFFFKYPMYQITGEGGGVEERFLRKYAALVKKNALNLFIWGQSPHQTNNYENN